MKRLNQWLKSKVELGVFGVCSSIGDKLGIPSTKLRLAFIYISCLTFFSPVLLYISLAMVKDFKNFIFNKSLRKKSILE